jgi:hypothetical protein
MRKARPTYLKVSISLDLEQETDRALLEFSDSLPAGMKANVLRRLLAQALPKSDAELQKLLGQVAMDAHLRNQCAGRPRQNQREAVPRQFAATHVVPQGGVSASEIRGEDTGADPVELGPEEIGNVVHVAGPVDDDAAGKASPLMGNQVEEEQGPTPPAAASGVPAKRKLNVGNLIPSFAS